AKGDFYWALNQSQLRKASEKDVLVKLLKERAKLPWGKAVNGLAARAELIKHDGGCEIRFSVKNASAKALRVFAWPGAKPLSVAWTSSAGQKRDVKVYDQAQTADLPAPTEDDYPLLPPGGILFIGPLGKHAGISIPKPEPGDRITVRYVNKDAGKDFRY